MIKKAIIKNFKSHSNTEIEFHKNITAFQGLSSHGKTALIRAIKLACTFRPIGSKYISHFSKNKKCEIDLEFENGEIYFQKTKSNAKYILNKDAENPFGTLNKTIPEEITDFIKLDEDNFIGQFDRPYLIFSEKSAISKKINETLGIERWDEKLKNITKKINDCKREINRIYTNIKDKKRILSDIEKCRYNDLNGLIETKKEIILKINKYKEKNNILNKIKIQLQKNNVKHVKKNIEKIENLIDKLDNKNKQIQEYEIILKNLEIIKKWKDKKEQINAIFETKNKISNKLNLKNALNQDIENLKNGLEIINSIMSLNSKIKEIKKQEEEIKKQYNKMETCPECGQTLTKI